MERNNHNKHVVCNKNNDDDEVDVDRDDYGVDNGDANDDKHITNLSQAADCYLIERSKNNKHVVWDKDDDVDDCVGYGDDNCDDDSDKCGDDVGIDDGDDSADKNLTHLSQAPDCCLMERSKHNKNVVFIKVDDVNDVDDDIHEDGVQDCNVGADKHLTYLSQAADCCLIEEASSTSMLSAIKTMMSIIVLKMVMMMVLMMALTVLTSISHFSHKQLIVLWWRDSNITSMLDVIKTMMLMMVLMMVIMALTCTSRISHKQ
eukprot:4491769-Ditylum_brightwellii.AAC.1